MEGTHFHRSLPALGLFLVPSPASLSTSRSWRSYCYCYCKPGLSSFLSYASNVCGYSCELSVISDLVLKDLSFQGGQIITEW